VNTLMRGVDKDDFLAIDRENHQISPPSASIIYIKADHQYTL
jgi:hypothetical protein